MITYHDANQCALIQQVRATEIHEVQHMEPDNIERGHLHERVVDEGPGARSLQHVVQVVLQLPVARVPPAALRPVRQRLAEQTETGAAGSPRTLGAAHRPAPSLHILHAVVLGPAPWRRFHPEARGAFVAAVVARHRIASAGCTRALGTARARIKSDVQRRNFEQRFGYKCLNFY